MSLAYLRARYTLDRIVAACVLPCVAPVLLALAAAVRLDSAGPAFFRQRRIGQDGRPFTVYKLRTMHVWAPPFSTKVADDDARITRLGRILRRTGLDELPQVWNILRGEMSWIGPRPEQPFLVDGYAEWERVRLRARPGLTGWWQVRRRGCEHMRDHADLDVYYVEHASAWLDARILLLTPLALWRAGTARRGSVDGTSRPALP